MATKVTSHVIADNAVTDAKLHSDFTATTQSASDNSTNVATTAYVTTAIANLSDSAPSTLNTLNELAAALGDDANFSTTVTNSIAAKLPLAGGTLTGNITMGGMMLKPSADGGSIGLNRNPDNGSHVGDSGLRRFQINGPDSTGGDFLQFQAYNSSGTHQGNMTFTDGYLGIGETAPDTFLHVKGTGSGGHGTIKMEGESAHLGFTRSDSNFRSWIGQYNSSGHGSDTDFNIKTGYVGGSSSTGNIRISANGDTTAAQVYLKGSSGNLGVGAGTSPSERLTIGGGIGTNSSTAFASMGGRLGFGNDYSDTQRGPNKIVLQNDGAWIAGLGISDDSVDLYSGGKFTFLDSASASSYATRMVIDNNGKVGIGVSSPGSTFSVGHTAAHSNNRITIFSDDYNYGQIRVGSSTTEASVGFMRSTTQANTDAASPSGGNNTWAIGLGVWGANFGIGSNSILDNCVEWDSSGHMLPGTNNTYDLGSTAKGWRNIYTNDLNLSNMPSEGTDVEGNPYTREGNEVDGTNGSWTIQEGSDDLYLLNRLNGKKYKFKLEEVS